MTPQKENIKEFFQGEKQYSIPVYQRAYSWEEQNWRAFFEDLQEATKGENHYFFGNVLLEKSKEDTSKIDIIDGQQRITTIVIFVRAMLNVLEKRAQKEQLDTRVKNEDFLESIKETYLIANHQAKLEAVEYDKTFFGDLIIKNGTTSYDPQTPSQERIKKAKEFFEKALDKENTEAILKMFKAMQNAEILSIPFTNKKDSVLMFELQNNRGKALTDMEKLKSYFAYQIYTYCSKEESEHKLNEITNIFKDIYAHMNRIYVGGFNEDSILRYFNQSQFGFNYRENDDTLNYKKYLKDVAIENKIAWIEQYMKGLKEAFIHFVDFLDEEKTKSVYADYLLELDVAEICPFIIKAYHLFGKDNKEQLERVFQALEIIAFRNKLVKTRADFASRLNEVLKNFTKVEDLENGLKAICTEKWYWRDDAVIDALLNTYEDNRGILPYIFMRYENHLRAKDVKEKGYSFSLKDIKERTIEHIAPQTENGKRLASGYDKYDDKFLKEYLHCIGNLLLIDKSHNSSLGNKPFKEKLASYENLAQQREIKDFVKNDKWDKDAIDGRHEKIEKFVLKTWSFK